MGNTRPGKQIRVSNFEKLQDQKPQKSLKFQKSEKPISLLCAIRVSNLCGYSPLAYSPLAFP